jgi:hypothetical protein
MTKHECYDRLQEIEDRCDVLTAILEENPKDRAAIDEMHRLMLEHTDKLRLLTQFVL